MLPGNPKEIMEHIAKGEATPEEVVSLGRTMHEFRNGDIYAALKINADVSIRQELSSKRHENTAERQLGYLEGIQYLEDSINGMIVSGEQVEIQLSQQGDGEHTPEGVPSPHAPIKTPKKRR